MEEVYVTNISLDESQNDINNAINYNNTVFCWADENGNADILTYIILSICLPVAPVAVYSLCGLVQNDHIAPIFVINLLISDFIQLCCMIVYLSIKEDVTILKNINFIIYICCVTASVGFMVCVAVERYLAIVCPVWYRFERSVKTSVMICVVVWFLSTLEVLLTIDHFALIVLTFFLLLFVLQGTFRALSTAQSVPTDEKWRIVAILVTVLVIYLIVFMPGLIFFILFIMNKWEKGIHIFNMFCSLIQLNPLLDLFLYFFMKKWAIDKILAHLCCCRMTPSNQQHV